MAYKTPCCLTDAGRFSDIMKQGFMKPFKPGRAPKKIIRVACCGCQNWHVKGAHTEPHGAVRKANLQRYRENDKKFSNYDGKLRPMEDIISK